MFGGYRTAHEWQMTELAGLGLLRAKGELNDAQFLTAAGARITRPVLEMDSATCHHLYAEVLRDHFPNALFVHTIRDVRSWVTSVLDMMLRKRIARTMLAMDYSGTEIDYLASMTGGAYDLHATPDTDDSAAVPALLRYWSAHLRRLAEALPSERTLRVHTSELGDSAAVLAGLVGVDPATLHMEVSHANRASIALDRMAAFDSSDVRETYDEYCAESMAEHFPVAHLRWQESAKVGAVPSPSQWQRHYGATEVLIAESVRRIGSSAGR
jgi:hypothetical protein